MYALNIRWDFSRRKNKSKFLAMVFFGVFFVLADFSGGGFLRMYLFRTYV